MEVAISSDYYNCSSCNLNFQDAAFYKKHYATKFHQYNVKRKVIDLPPVSQEQYDARFNTYSEQQKQVVQARQQIQSANRCDACQKTFANKNSYLSHLQSKKHIENEKKRQQRLENSETQSQQSKTTNQTKTQQTTLDDISVCLFCNIKSKDLEKNMKHMEKFHGFFVAEANYVSDLPGLIKYLAEKIHLGNICLECDNKGKDFKSGEAVQTHMLDKGHCFMSKKNFDEYTGYYDFSTNKEKEQQQLAIKEEEKDELNEVEVGEKQELNAKQSQEENEDEWEDEDDEEWEDEESEEENQEEIKEEDEEESEEETEESKAKKELNDIKNKKIQTEKDRQKELKKQFRQQYRQLNKQRLAKVNYAESGELEFDNGKVVGHRQYKKYYNMFYRNRADPFANLKSIMGPESIKQRQIMLQQKNYSIQLYNKNQQQLVYNKTDRITHKSIHNYKRHTLRVGMGNNKTKQHHYVNQNPL